MQRQVDRMVSNRISAADLVIQPERKIRERTRLHRPPHFPPPGRRRQDRIGEDRVIVEMEAAAERRAECDQRRDGEDQAVTHAAILRA
jgi:hypothetical protein